MSAYTDPYTRSAEHLDLLSRQPWTLLAPNVIEALSAVTADTVVEIAAGTGLGTAVIADVCSSAEILAVEPSDHLRAILLHRIASDEHLRSRVTVDGTPFPQTQLPTSFDALVLINSLGHFSPADRDELWHRLATGLTAGGCAVLNLQAPTTPTAIPEFEMSRERVGRRDYHGTAWAERIDHATVLWHMAYRISEDGRVVDARDVEYLWHTLGPTELLAELAVHALAAEAVGNPMFGVHRITAA